jgi:hypothetical protein
MSYATTNPPKCMVPRVGGGQALWLYTSTDIHTDVDGTDYFSDGDALGMKVGDVLIAVKSDATIGATLHSVQTVTAGGAATLSPAILT